MSKYHQEEQKYEPITNETDVSLESEESPEKPA